VVEHGTIAFDGPASGYAGCLEVTVWVQTLGVSPERLTALPHVLRGRVEGGWAALDCHDERVAGLLTDLDAIGVSAERVRLGGPSADPGHSTSPSPRQEERR
jgi:hypothetical protein